MGQIRMMPKASPAWERREYGDALLNAASEGILGLDAEGRCTFANRAAATALGFRAEELIGADLHSLVHPHASSSRSDECSVYRVFRGARSARQLACSLRRKDGTQLSVAISSEPVAIDGRRQGIAVTMCKDAYPEQQEQTLWKLEKLASIGQLASSIAHEINNPLESITNLLYLIQRSGSAKEMRQYAGLAQDELARVTEITLQTLRFHRQRSRPAEIDMAELLGTVMALYTGRLLVRNIEIDVKLKAVSKTVCVEGEVRQVINNLVRNALDAMPDGGKLFVRLHEQSAPHTGTRGVRLTVADEGEGISAAILPRLFQPFQTTKEMTGTGLGLWVSKGIVEKHGGYIRYRTGRGDKRHGTVFTVWLPVEPSLSLNPAED